MDFDVEGSVPYRFSTSYVDARRKFLLAVDDNVNSYATPARGPANEELITDAAWFGNRDAKRIGILVSATHGVEGYCGSAAQLDWILAGGPLRLASDEAVLLVHALNSYGFAW